MRETDYKDGEIQVHRYEFSDWHDFLEFGALKGRHASNNHSETNGANFTSLPDMPDSKTRSMADAIKLAANGWTGGAARIQAGQLRHFEAISNRILRDDPVNDVEGCGFDVSLVLANEPEAWLRYEQSIAEVQGVGNIIRIVLNASVSSGIETEVIFRRGEAVAAVCELLEHAGRRVELIVLPVVSRCSRDAKTKRIESTLLVKDAHQPMDFARLAFALCHPSLLRRFGFKIIEEAGSDYDYFTSASYGHPASPPARDREDCQIYIKEGLLTDTDFQTVEAARAWVIRTLESQGVELEVH